MTLIRFYTSGVPYHKIDTTPAEDVFGPYLTKFAAYQKFGARIVTKLFYFPSNSLKTIILIPNP